MSLLGKPSKQWVLAILLGGSVLTAFMGPAFSARLRSMASYALAPLGDGGMYLATALKEHTRDIGQRAVSPAEARRLREERDSLVAQVRELHRQQDILRRQIGEIQGIHRSYHPVDDAPYELVPARVVASDSLPYGDTRLLNVGRRSDVRGGDVVTTVVTDRAKALPPRLAAITGSLLVGRLRETSAFTARLELVTDRAFKSPAYLVRDPARPRQIIVTEGDAQSAPLTEANNLPIWCPEIQGDGEGGILIRSVKKYHNIQPGDWVETTGLGHPPFRIRIAKVTDVQEDPTHRGLFVNVRAQPLADLGSLREVYVVVPMGDPQRQGRSGEAR